MSIQKVLGLVAYPLALLLMDKKPLPSGLKWLGLALVATYSISGLTRRDLSGAILSADISVLLSGLAAYTLYLAMLSRPSALEQFLNTWTFFSVTTSIICVLQVFELFPLITGSDSGGGAWQTADGVIRAWGLKSDANFQALMLVLGVVSAQLGRSRRSLFTILIFCGLFATFSRMGLILGAIALFSVTVVRSILAKSTRELFGKLALATLVSMFAIAMFTWIGTNDLTEFIVTRVDEAVPILDVLSDGFVDTTSSRQLSSTETRAALLFASFGLANENLPFGAGPYQSESLMADTVGLENVSHNVYMEWLITGGFVGALPPLVYVIAVKRSLRRAWVLGIVIAPLLIACWITFAVAGCFLSFTYNSIIWLPMVVSDLVTDRYRNCNQAFQPLRSAAIG